jgi:hypothetical protein
VHLQHGNLPSGAPVFLDIEDCDADGLLDAFVPWSDMGAAPPATFYTGAACPPVGIKSISISFVGNSGPSTWRAYGPFGLLATQTRPGGGPQVVTLTSTKTHIVRVELQGDEICVKEVCWTCRTRKPWFFRGDFNSDGIRDISDAIAGLNYLFVSGEEPGCLSAADSNDDGELDLSDPTHLLAHLFNGGQEPAGGTECNLDETEDELTCEDSGLCSQDEPTDPTDELAERLSVFIGADIRPQDLQLMPVEELGNVQEAPEYVQRALQTEGSQFLLVSMLEVEGFSQALYEVPPANREAYQGAQFVKVVDSRMVSIGGDSIEWYVAKRCQPIINSRGETELVCLPKAFSYPTSDRCHGCPGVGPVIVLDQTKCDAGSLVNVTIEVEPNGLAITNTPGSCDGQPTAILEDLVSTTDTGPIDELVERLSVFIGADIRPEDIQLTPVEELGNKEGTPEYVQRALQTPDSKYLLVSVPEVEGFSRALYEVPPVNGEAYLGAQFVSVVDSILKPIPGADRETYGCKRCNQGGGGCPLKQFSRPCEHDCTGCEDDVKKQLKYTKCDEGSLVNVTIETTSFIKLGDIKGEAVSCNSLPTAIFEDLGL